MPNFDRTGPQGQGPMTGRRGGFAGRGLRCCARPFPYGRVTEQDEKEIVKEYLEDLKAEVGETEKYLTDLEGKK